MKKLEEKCKHEFLKFKEHHDVVGDLGTCYYCKTIRRITDDYRKVSGNVYELKPIKINAKECRE